MPWEVNGQPVTEELIRQEFGRLGRDPQWQNIADLNERASRLHAAAEHCAQDRLLIEQTAAADPRPIDVGVLEREVSGRRTQWGGPAPLDDSELRRIAELNLRVQRTRHEMVAGAIPPTEEEMEAFFDANRHNFTRPELFHASHIVKHVNHEQSEEQAETAIEAALADLERGDTFAEVAARHSDCKDNGGDLGKFPAGHMVEEFDEVIHELAPGERSDIFTTPFGFHIALLHDIIPAGLADFEDVRPDIERVMTFARQHEAYQRAIAEMRSRADICWVPFAATGAG
jgi:hypothetical protein